MEITDFTLVVHFIPKIIHSSVCTVGFIAMVSSLIARRLVIPQTL